MNKATQLTPKQAAFCRLYLETGNASEAYRQAYVKSNLTPATVHVKASHLLNSDKIAARVCELQGELRQRHRVTVDSLLAELEEARQAALTAKKPQAAAAVTATMGKAKLAGLDKEVVELTGDLQITTRSLQDIFHG